MATGAVHAFLSEGLEWCCIEKKFCIPGSRTDFERLLCDWAPNAPANAVYTCYTYFHLKANVTLNGGDTGFCSCVTPLLIFFNLLLTSEPSGRTKSRAENTDIVKTLNVDSSFAVVPLQEKMLFTHRPGKAISEAH